MKRFLFVALILNFGVVDFTQACSMFKYTINGKTFVGNNEDWTDPNAWMWIESDEAEENGVVFFGFSDFFPQGGINDKGLVFDGFAMPDLQIKNIEGKKAFYWELFEDIMHSSSTVDEVKSTLIQYNLSPLSTAQLMFVDKSGTSIIVEGDEIIESTESYQIATNFYQSLVPKEGYAKTCTRYATIQSMLKDINSFTAEFGISVLDAAHQDIRSRSGPGLKTQYSNLYDLDKGIIYLSLHSNFNDVVELSVSDLVKKGNHKLELNSLFVDDKTYSDLKNR